MDPFYDTESKDMKYAPMEESRIGV